jgi:hypothetical protein
MTQLPNFLKPGTVTTFFSKNPNMGRYGLFPFLEKLHESDAAETTID